MKAKLYRFDGVLWSGDFTPQPFCPVHRLEMDSYAYTSVEPYIYNVLRCEDCEKDYILPRSLSEEQTYLRRKLKSISLKEFQVLNIDGESVPIAESKVSTQDKKFFVKAILTESRVGQRLVVYVGERGSKEKTQIFVEPSIKRLAFDQSDIHPSEVFLSLEATFKDGTTSSIKRKKT